MSPPMQPLPLALDTPLQPHPHFINIVASPDPSGEDTFFAM